MLDDERLLWVGSRRSFSIRWALATLIAAFAAAVVTGSANLSFLYSLIW